MILILTNRKDPHADRVEAILRQRSAATVRFDPGDFPARARFVLGHDGERASMALETTDERIDLATVKATWLRRPSLPQPSERIVDPTLRQYAGLELQLFAEGVWEALDCPWLPGRQVALRAADHKLKQLILARQLGLVVPPTLLTNDAASLMEFYEAHHGQLISKLPTPAIYWIEPRVAVRYTQSVTRGDLGHWPMLRYAPLVFQPRIAKAYELRVTVVGERVFAASVKSQQNWRTAVDSRADFAHTPYESHALDSTVAARCRELVHGLGLTYATIDFIVTPAGEHLFLELNPNGQYLWIEDRTGLAISAAVAELLVEMDGSHDRALATSS